VGRGEGYRGAIREGRSVSRRVSCLLDGQCLGLTSSPWAPRTLLCASSASASSSNVSCPWGIGSASFGDSGTFSAFSPDLSSLSFLSLSLAETPPSVPVFPLGDSLSGSSMTPSPSTPNAASCSLVFSSVVEAMRVAPGRSSSTPPSVFFGIGGLSSMYGPSCGFPSNPSTGASLVAFEAGVGDGFSELTEESSGRAARTTWVSSRSDLIEAAKAPRAGRRRRRAGALWCRSLMVLDDGGNVDRGIARQMPARCQTTAGDNVIPGRDNEGKGAADVGDIRTWQMGVVAMVDC
jgi:hypothetical protein